MARDDTATHHRHYSDRTAPVTRRRLPVPPARLASLAPLAAAWRLPSVRALAIRYARRLGPWRAERPTWARVPR